MVGIPCGDNLAGGRPFLLTCPSDITERFGRDPWPISHTAPPNPPRLPGRLSEAVSFEPECAPAQRLP